MDVSKMVALAADDISSGIAPNPLLMQKLDDIYQQVADPGISSEILRLRNRLRIKQWLGRDLLKMSSPPPDRNQKQFWEIVHQLKDVYNGAHAEADGLGDRYALGRRIGQGGMSEVIEAVRRSDGQVVAIKYLRPEHFNKKGYIDRFNRECTYCLKFDHPHIVRSYEAGEHNGHGFIVMEYLPLGDIERIIAYSHPGLAMILEVARQAADALAYLHDQMNVVHRDVKLTNLLVDSWPVNPDESVGQIHIKLTDFGLSKEMKDDGYTRVGANMGTKYYQAPEMKTDAGSADHRADIYSLGMATYRMLSGNASPTEAYQNLHQAMPEVPLKLAELLEHALKPDRNERLASAAEFTAIVEEIQGEINVT